jgi:hypothetical protein
MRALAVLFVGLALVGCSKTGSSAVANAAASTSPPGAATPATAAPSAVAGDCERHAISQADVQPLLGGPITSVKPAPSDADACVFSTDGFSSITVTVRPGQGKQTLESWKKGPVTSLPGVGDDAVWEPDLKEVVASRNDTLCTVTAMGPQVTAATAETEGALCNKVFAAL